jgi:hypothetical protein
MHFDYQDDATSTETIDEFDIDVRLGAEESDSAEPQIKLSYVTCGSTCNHTSVRYCC